MQEQDLLRQHARSVLSIIQRNKVQLIELRPTLSDEANQTLRVRCSPTSTMKRFFLLFCFSKKIDEELRIQTEIFDQALENYRRDHGNFSDDLEKIIGRIQEDVADVRVRLEEKQSEIYAYNIVRDEYDNLSENLLTTIQIIEGKIEQSQDTDIRLNLDLFKVSFDL